MVRMCCSLVGLALLLTFDLGHAFSLRSGNNFARSSKVDRFSPVQQVTVRKRSKSIDSTEEAKVFLEISEAPPKFLEARQNGKVDLECVATGKPAPEVVWYKNGRPIGKQVVSKSAPFSPYSMSETRSLLSLDCVTEADQGIYECVAFSNGQKGPAVATEVTVTGSGYSSNTCVSKATPPQITQWMPTYLQMMGTDAHLVCRTQDGGQHDTNWVGPDEEVINGGDGKYEILANGDLLIRDLTFAEMGMFKCFVRNQFGEDMKETFLYPHAA